MSFSTSSQQNGFTLIELLIVLAIAGVLLNMALPGLSRFLTQNHQQSTLYTLFSHHQLARSEAIKSKQSMILCKSNNGEQCTSDAQWQDGWIIFSDTDNNKKISANDRVIKVQQALNNTLTLSYKGFGSHNYVRYFPDGHSTTNGSFVLCNSEGDAYSKALVISRTGRARIDPHKPGVKIRVCD